jgi:C-terminal processing protease CtpA/Prc/Tol biopolymer transport system component
VLFTSARGDSKASSYFPTGALPELYEVSVDGGTPTRRLTTPAEQAVWSPDGDQIAYREEKAYEDDLRKHDTSAFARDLWTYDVASGEHTKVTDFTGADHDPVWSPSGDALYYLSERSGAFNVWRLDLASGTPTQVTEHTMHPVRDLSIATDGTLAYTHHGVLYRRAPDGPSEAVDVQMPVARTVNDPTPMTLAGQVDEYDVGPEGEDVVYVARGDVFVTSIEYGTTVQITATPEQERSASFAPDGRSIVYASERGDRWAIYETSLTDDDEPRFSVATAFEEELVYETDGEAFQPRYSPDGETIAFIQNRDAIMALDRETGAVTELYGPTLNYSYSDGDLSYTWSPDSRWVSADFVPRGYLFYTDIGIAPADGSAAPRDISMNGYSDASPTWHDNGEIIYWISDRYGERSHGSWGGEVDVVAAFLTQEAWDRFHMNAEERALLEDDESSEADGENDAASEDDEPEPVSIEWEHIDDRTARLTIHSSDLAGAALTSDATKLYYLAAFESGYDLWMHDFVDDETRRVTKLGARQNAGIELTNEDKTAIVRADGRLLTVDLAAGTATPLEMTPEKVVRADAERDYLFEHVWRQVKDKFYASDLHGVDWAQMKAEYAAKLDGVATQRDFAILLSEMLGELNASHTGARYRPRDPDAKSTGSLGVIYDLSDTSDGIVIDEILAGGPLSKADLNVEPGMAIVAVNGTPITATENLYAHLNRTVGERVRLTLRDEGETRDVVTKPISGSQESNMRYERWVEQRRAIASEVSDGRIGYLHVRSMSDAGFRQAFSELFGRNINKEAVVVDTRFNGGGWLHDDLLVLLSGERYFNLRPRGRVVRGEPVERWTKPSAVLMNEGNYSDAYMFPFAYDKFDVGPTVGMPVPGTGTAVWWETLHTGDIVFGIPQLPALDDGEPVENRQLEPDVKVNNPPEAAAAGRDEPLEAAVQTLLDRVNDETNE